MVRCWRGRGTDEVEEGCTACGPAEDSDLPRIQLRPNLRVHILENPPIRIQIIFPDILHRGTTKANPHKTISMLRRTREELDVLRE
jgi:hypothetical protein